MAQKKAKVEPTKETEAPKQAPMDQLTFTEAEHKSLVDYMNFVTEHATFGSLKEPQIHARAVNNVQAINVVKKIESHIFELKRKLSSSKREG